MKTYKIEMCNEPLKEGFLTQFGVLKERNRYVDYRHLKCYEVDDSKCRCDKAYVKVFNIHNNGCKGHTEITDPSELQRIWEGIRYSQLPDARPEVHKPSIEEGIDRFQEWQNFTLEPGLHEVEDNTKKEQEKRLSKMMEDDEKDGIYDIIEPAPEELKKAMSRTSSKAIAKVLGSNNNDPYTIEELIKEQGFFNPDTNNWEFDHECIQLAADSIRELLNIEQRAINMAKVLPDNTFEQLLQKELDKLPFEKGLDDGGYNDGQIAGFEVGARWANGLGSDNNGWITEGLAEDILHITDDPRRDYSDDESTYKKIIEIIKSHQYLNT